MYKLKDGKVMLNNLVLNLCEKHVSNTLLFFIHRFSGGVVHRFHEQSYGHSVQSEGLQRLTSTHHVRHHTADSGEKVKCNHYSKTVEEKTQK